MFNPDLLNSTITQNGNAQPERMEISATDSSDSTDPINESRITRRSIRVPPINNNNESRSRSMSIETKRPLNSMISSSEENLFDKNK